MLQLKLSLCLCQRSIFIIIVIINNRVEVTYSLPCVRLDLRISVLSALC